MPTTVTKIVDPDNGAGTDYTSLSAAEAGEQQNLVTNDRIMVFECRSTSGTSNGGGTSIGGWTTDSTRYIIIQSSGSNKHTGLWDTSKFRIVNSTSNNCLEINQAYTRVIGIQLQCTSNSFSVRYAIYLNSGTNLRVSQCIIKVVGSSTSATTSALGDSTSGASETTYFYNNLILMEINTTSGAQAIHKRNFGGNPFYIENNTIINTGNSSNVGLNVGNNGGFIARNNLLKGFSNTNTYSGTFSSGTDYNTTDSTDSIGTGSNNKTSQTFSFTNSGSGDYSLTSSDTGAKDSGTTLATVTAAFTDDIIGTARPSSGAIDCGCFEYAATAAICGNYYYRFLAGDFNCV